MSTTYFMIDAGQLLALERVQKILHAERRLDGDAMRDLGHTIESIVRTCRELPVPDNGKPSTDFVDPEDCARELQQLVLKYRAALAQDHALPPMAEQHYMLALTCLEQARANAYLAHLNLMRRD
jgi:hypothetical protein